MRADVYSLAELFHTANTAYVIPSYQRPFVWTPGKALELLEAIYQDSESDSKLPPPPGILTSIGTILICEVPTRGQSGNPYGNNTPKSIAPSIIWEVVDGQQRLIVFAIIGHALSERYAALGQQGLNYSPTTELDLFFSTARAHTGPRVPNIIRDEDNYDTGLRSDIAQLLDGFLRGSHSNMLASNLSEVNRQVVKWVEERLNIDNFEKFTEYFLHNCQVIRVTADNQDLAFTMFEPLNSTSEPLTALEVYRSKVIKGVNSPPPFTKTFSLVDYDNSKRDDVIRKSNDLVFYTSQIYSGERPRKSFVPLKKYLDKHVNRDFIGKMELTAEFLQTVWFDQTNTSSWFTDETKDLIRFLRAAGHDACIPLLGRYFVDQPQELPRIVKAVAAFYALWRANYPTNKLPSIYRQLFTANSADNMACENGKLKAPDELVGFLRGHLDKEIAPPKSHSPFDIWKTCRYLFYDQIMVVCRLYILTDIGASLRPNLVPNDPWTKVDDIDHIAPESLGWPNIHSIGNLTFLPLAINRSLKDKGWNEKRPLYEALASPQRTASIPHNAPEAVKAYLSPSSNNPALVHLQDIASHATWGPADIDARSESIKQKVWATLYGQWLQ